MKRESLTYINGKIQTTEEAAISVTDIGFQRGYGVFDYIRTYNGKLFHPQEHLRRFRHSASELFLKLSVSNQEIIKLAKFLIQESNLQRPAVRLILTGGSSNDVPSGEHPNFIMMAEELPSYPEKLYSSGGTLISFPYQRELPHVKTLNYLNAIRLGRLKEKSDAFDILYFWEKKITECPRNNFFVFCGNTLVTPKNNILYGITRNIVLQLAKKHFPVKERTVYFDELKTIDEAFVTSTSKGVLPVVQIDKNKIGDGLVGIRTKEIMNLFGSYTTYY